MEHPWGKEIQVCSNKVPRVIYGPHPRGLNFYIWISLKNLLLKNHLANFNQTWQITCLREWEFRFVQIRCWPLLGPNKGQNKDNFDKSSKIFFS